MKYLKNRPFEDRKGNAIQVTTTSANKQTVENVFLNELLIVLLNSYQPIQNLVLTVPEIRKYYKALDVLEKKSDLFEFDNDVYEIMKKTVMALILSSLMLAKYAPILEDMLNSALDANE
mgnify:CR=1 FL=1